MLNLSSYHSNGLPAVVWSNKVNLIGEKVYKPKIHFCEHCNKPILLYGRLIPCKHVFCFSCATLCLSQQQQSSLTAAAADHDLSLDSPASNNSNVLGPPGTPAQLPSNGTAKGCHRCGGKALRVERNILNSIFVCQIETCRRTYLSARDLQAHVNHRHSKHKSNNNYGGAGSASLAAISSSPYISSSSLLHLNNHNNSTTSKNPNSSSNNHNQQRHLASSSSVNHSSSNNNTNSPSYRHQQHHNRHDRDNHQRNRDRDRFSDREFHQRDRDRDGKEYHRQSLQRAAQWAEASAQMMEKGFTR